MQTVFKQSAVPSFCGVVWYRTLKVIKESKGADVELIVQTLTLGCVTFKKKTPNKQTKQKQTNKQTNKKQTQKNNKKKTKNKNKKPTVASVLLNSRQKAFFEGQKKSSLQNANKYCPRFLNKLLFSS